MQETWDADSPPVVGRGFAEGVMLQGTAAGGVTDWEVPRHRGSRTNAAYANEAQKLGS